MSTELKVKPYPYPVYYLLAHSTIDTVIYGLINKKKSVAAKIMNSDDDIPKDTAYFDELADMFSRQNEGKEARDGDMQD